MREVTQRGIDFIIDVEGVRLDAYDDETGRDWSPGDPLRGKPTIGVGHLLTKRELNTGYVEIGGRRVPWEDGFNRQDVHELLEQDLDVVEEAINRLCPGLSDNQFDALAAFIFNIGAGNFEHPDPKRSEKPSKVLLAIRQGRLEDVPDEMAKWNRSMGQVNNGLIRRREREGALWRAS